MIRLEETLLRVRGDLDDLGAKWAVVGGLAVAVRAEPRTTRDVDVVVVVADDAAAERLCRDLFARGYQLAIPPLENVETGRISTIRLHPPIRGGEWILVDLLLTSCGIEPEIVEAAQEEEVLPGVRTRVIRRGHLMAMKALAGRLQDLADLEKLVLFASEDEIREAREAAALIVERDHGRDRKVQRVLEEMIERGSAG